MNLWFWGTMEAFRTPMFSKFIVVNLRSVKEDNLFLGKLRRKLKLNKVEEN